MTDDWLELSPWEIAFLAGAPGDRPTPLERVVPTGTWLRDPAVQQAGAGLMALRIEKQPLWTESAVAAVAVAAQRLPVATAVSALSLKGSRDVCLLTFESEDLGTQVLLGSSSALVRSIALPLDEEQVAAELATLVEPAVVTGFRWSEAHGDAGFAWSADAQPEGGAEAPLTPAGALRAGCGLVGGRS